MCLINSLCVTILGVLLMFKKILVFIAIIILPFNAISQEVSDTVWSKNLWPKEVADVMYSPFGEKVFVSTRLGDVYIFDAITGDSLRVVVDMGTFKAYSPDGYFIYTSKALKIDATTFEPIDTIKHFGIEGYQIIDLDVTSDGTKLIIVGRQIDGVQQQNWAIAIASTEQMEIIEHIDYPGGMNLLALSPDGKHFVTNWGDGKWDSDSKNGKLLLWDAQSFEFITIIDEWDDGTSMYQLKFSSSGKYLCLAKGLYSRIYSTNNWEKVIDLEDNEIGITTVSFSKNDNYIFTGTPRPEEEPAKIWHIETGTVLFEYLFSSQYDGLLSSDVSSNNQFIIAGGVNNIYLLNAKWDDNNIEEIKYDSFSLLLYPNPNHSEVEISYNLPQAGRVTIEVVDQIGNLIKRFDLNGDEGTNTFKIDTQSYSAGSYFIKLLFNSQEIVQKLVKN